MKNEQKNLSYIVFGGSFLASLVGIFLIMQMEGCYPFGEKTLFAMDMQDQYLEFFTSLRYVLKGNSSIFFSWSRSMGGNFFGVFAYYLANPLSFVTTFFAIEDMPLAVAVLTALKIALCGLTFSIYANYFFRSGGKSQILIIPISVSYALMSYNITYMMCLMWLDGVIFLPLILLGIEKILAGGKGIFYCLSYIGLLFCNYYTGYMVGIFAGLYIFYRVFSLLTCKNIQKYVKKMVRFIICTLLAIGCSAPILLPVIIDLCNGRLVENTLLPFAKIYNYDSYNTLFTQFKCGAYKSLDGDGMPAIYCGIVAFFLSKCFFSTKDINKREKLGAFLAVLFFAISFYFAPLDLVWHGFQHPVSFPYRYSFLFGFIILYMTTRMVSSVSGEVLK